MKNNKDKPLKKIATRQQILKRRQQEQRKQPKQQQKGCGCLDEDNAKNYS